MEIITDPRFIARTLLGGMHAGNLRFVDITGSRLEVSPFEHETPATVFIDGRVALINRNASGCPSAEELEGIYRNLKKAYGGEAAVRFVEIMADGGWIASAGTISSDVLPVEL